MNNVVEYIVLSFKNDILNEGMFWRINRPNTFVDLIMINSYKAEKEGITTNLVRDVIIISLKAIINNKYGIVDFKLDYNDILKLVSLEEKDILLDAENILKNSLDSCKKNSSLLYHNLSYFKVLNNLKINHYSTHIFKNILDSSVCYLDSES